MPRPVRTNGVYDQTGIEADWWPGGRGKSHTSGPVPSQAWITGGRNGSSVFGGGGAYSYGADGVGYGYGPIGPNGPWGGNLPGRLPDRWWYNYGDATDLVYPPAITRASSIVIGGVLGAPMEFSRIDDPAKLKSPQWWVNPMLAARVQGPNGPQMPAALRRTASEFWSTVLYDAVMFGRGVFTYGYDRDGDGTQPLAGSFQLLSPFQVALTEDRTRWVINPGDERNEITCDLDGEYSDAGQRRRLMILRGMPPHQGVLEDDFWGGVVTRHMLALGLLNDLNEYTDVAFRSPIPSGVLSSTDPAMTQEEANQLRAAWERAHSGGNSVAVLNSTVSFDAIKSTPLQQMAVDSMGRWTLTQIAHAFRLSAHWLDQPIGDSLTYGTLSDIRQDLVSQTLAPTGAQLEQMLDTMLPAGTRATIRWSAFTQPDEQSLVETWLPVHAAGLISDQEFRSKVNLPAQYGDAVDLNDRR